MDDNISNFVANTLTNFETLSKKPEIFLSSHSSHTNDLKQSLKDTYDFIKTEEGCTKVSAALPKLVIDEFDSEQIWQQIELQNDTILTKSLINASRLIVKKDNLTFITSVSDENTSTNEKDGSSDEESYDELDSEDGNKKNYVKKPQFDEDDDDDEIEEFSSASEQELDEDEDTKTDRKLTSRNKHVTSIVDDEFFKLHEMENFLTTEDKNFNKNSTEEMDGDDDDDDDEESVDLFDGHLDDEEDVEDEKEYERLNNPRFKDFFREPENENKPTKRSKNLDLEQLDDDDKALKSTYEIRKERLAKKIETFEGKALAEKPWQLKGEIRADNRPQNSLLEEFVEFDLTTRPAPVITEETTFILEDVIRQRIKDKAWDSVERKQKPTDAPTEYKKKLILDQEKSKESLAQIYEKEYLKQKEALDPESIHKEEDEPKEHKEIRTRMTSLFTKLDALSNFHFTPKPAAPELKIISNLPAINMEEVAPVAISDGNLLAPEEVKGKTKGDEIGKSERTDTDKKRERRNKKNKQKEHARKKLKRDELAINNSESGFATRLGKVKANRLLEHVTKDRNVNKMDENKDTKYLKSSTAFFNQLQDEVSGHVKAKANNQSKKMNKNEFNAKKLKL